MQAGKALPPHGWIPRICNSPVKSLGEQEFDVPRLFSPTVLHLELSPLIALPVGLGSKAFCVWICPRTAGIGLLMSAGVFGAQKLWLRIWPRSLSGETRLFVFPTSISLTLDLMATPEPSPMSKSSLCSDHKYPARALVTLQRKRR